MVPAIQVEGVSKHYAGLKALDDVSMAIAQGEFFGLLGPNGAGKTTLINILAGLVRATRGAARVMGYDVVSDYRESRRALGVVPQELVFDPFFTVREALTFQSGYFGLRDNRDWIEEVMHHLDLTVRAGTNMRALSGGMKRRVLVAQALVHKPPVIVLDEPTAGVDVELRQALWQFIRRLNRDGHTVVLTTHYLEEAEALCGRIAMLKQGRVVALDTTQNLLRLHSGCYLELRLKPSRLPERLEPLVVQRREDGYRMGLKDYVEVERVIAELRAAGIEILELEVMQPDLEEAEALCGRIAMLKQGRIVALDTTQNLLRLHSGCYLELRLKPSRLPEKLEPLVVQRREDGYRMGLKDYVEVERVIAELRAAGIEILELEVMQPDLEEIFVQIMKRS